MDPEEVEKFFKVEKLFIIMTNSGKPVYSSQGDIYQLSPIIATLYAMLSKLQTIEVPRVTTTGRLVPHSELDQVQSATTLKEEYKQTLQNLDNNPYQKGIDTKEKLKVLSSKIKMKVSQKIDQMLENRKKRKEEKLLAAAQANAEAGVMPIGVPLIQETESESNPNSVREETKSTGLEASEDLESLHTSDQISQMAQLAQEEEASKVSQLLGISKLNNHLKIAFLTKGDVLIYLAISKDPRESIPCLRKQLEVLHLQFISITTSQVIENLRMHPSYDVVNDFSDYYHLLDNQIVQMK